MVNLWHHKSPYSWYVRLRTHPVSLSVCGRYCPDETLRDDTHNPPDVINEMIGVDRVQPHSDPVRRRKFLSCLVSVSVRTDSHQRERTAVRKFNSRLLAASLSVRVGGTLSSRSYIMTSDGVSKDFRSILSEDAGTDSPVSP